MQGLAERVHAMPPQRKRRLFEVSFLVLTLIVTAFCLSILLRAGGWPENQDSLNPKLRTEIYAAHFKDGDLFPIWSSSDAFGMGTPMPLYYQKLFYYLSGFLYIVTDSSIKPALMLSLVTVFLVGAYGMRLAVSKLTREKWLLLLVPQALLVANYTFTDWLVRGDVAELTAMMLIPWLLYWCLTLIQDRRFSWWFVPLVVLLVLAHNAIAMIAMLTVAIACIVFVATAGKEAILKALPRAVVAVIATSALLAPMLLMQLAFSKDFDPSTKITQGALSPKYNFQPAASYFLPRFWESSYVWLRNWRWYMTQIDYGIWIPIAMACILGVYVIVRHRFKRARTYFPLSAGVFLVATFTVNSILLFRISQPLYRAIRPLQLLQFPWRFLAIVTPVGLLLVAFIFAGIYKRYGPSRMAVALTIVWLGSFVALSPVLHSFSYPFMTASTFDTPTPATVRGIDRVIGGGEYLPKTYTASGQEVTSVEMVALYTNLADSGTQASGDPSCTIDRLPIHSFEAMQESFKIICWKPSQVFLPVTYSRYMRVTVNSSATSFTRKLTDPRLVVPVPVGSTTVTVTFPTVGYLIERAY